MNTLFPSDVVGWAVGRWHAEVANRPLQNVNRRPLDDTWRQVIRHFGGDPVILCGPAHDDLLCAVVSAPGTQPDPAMPPEGYSAAASLTTAERGEK